MTTPWVLPYVRQQVDPGTPGWLSRMMLDHPEFNIHPGDFGVWHATVPEDDGERHIAEHKLEDLLAQLDAHLDDPDTG